MRSWYDIESLEGIETVGSFAGLEDSRIYLNGLLDAEHKEKGIPYNRLFIAGFSQGGAMSLYTGNSNHPYFN